MSDENPCITAMITSGSILTVADTMAQYFATKSMRHQNTFDIRRTVAACIFGTFYYGIAARKIWNFYQTTLGPGRSMTKALIDCFVHTPFFGIPSYFLITESIKGKSINKIKSKLLDDWPTASTASIAYWIPVMAWNFKCGTPQTRVFVVCLCSCFHQTSLSLYSNRNTDA